MPCDWRQSAHGPPGAVRRKRRSAGNITAVEVDLEEDLGAMMEGEQLPKSAGNFSESLNLFQSIQVLANEEDERAFRNETASSK